MTEYMRVYNSIKSDVRSGNYHPGDFLPTEAELQKQYGVSRITIRRAISMLSQEGYVSVVQGRGTEICDLTTIKQGLNSVTSITETLEQNGHRITNANMLIALIVPPLEVKEALRIKGDETLYRLERIRCADGAPFAITTDYLKRDKLPDFESFEGKFTGLYDFLERQYGIVMTEAYESLSASSASFIEAQVLNVPAGTALLCSKRIGYTAQGPFEYTINKMIGDRYEYTVHMVGRNK